MTNAEKLDGVNFEKEFNSECAEKKRIARGELARKKGGGKTCRLPSDNLTKKQWEEKCSEVYSVNLKKMMSWEDYGHLEDMFKRKYLTYLIILGGNSATIADMFNLLDSNISAQEIQNEFKRLDVQPTLWEDPKEADENFQKWICDQLTNSETEEKEEEMKLPRIKLTDEQKELATPDRFYSALVQYVTLNKEHIVRNYNMVQKDTTIILNYINYKSSRDLHTDPTKVHLIMNRAKFVEWYLGQPRKSNLFQEEIIKNGIKTAYLDEETIHFGSISIRKAKCLRNLRIRRLRCWLLTSTIFRNRTGRRSLNFLALGMEKSPCLRSLVISRRFRQNLRISMKMNVHLK